MTFDFKHFFANQQTATTEEIFAAQQEANRLRDAAEQKYGSLQIALRKSPEENAMLMPQIEAAKLELQEARTLASTVDGVATFLSSRSQVRASQRTY